MGETTGISWTDHTFNPWIGCVKVSPGCTHCYAEELVKTKFGKPELWGPLASGKRRQVTSDANWKKPLTWNAAARKAGTIAKVFSGSMCDVFEDHPDANAARPPLFDVIRRTPFLSWQLLTKRPDNIVGNLPTDWGAGYPNVWLGTSVENQEYADSRIPTLLAIPAAVHFISLEPMLAPVDLAAYLGDDGYESGGPQGFVPTGDGLSWVIVGGESGPGYRPMDHEWARAVRDQCRAHRVPFFFKQSAAPRTEMGVRLDGEIVHEFPSPRITCGGHGDPWTCACSFHATGRRAGDKRAALGLFA